MARREGTAVQCATGERQSAPAAGTSPAANGRRRRGCRRLASGRRPRPAELQAASRFGRASSAKPAAAPAATGAPVRREGEQQRERPPGQRRHVAHRLDELKQKDRAGGEQHAAIEPARRECSRAPRRNVQNTARPPSSGTTKNGAHSPPIARAAAIVSGNPAGRSAPLRRVRDPAGSRAARRPTSCRSMAAGGPAVRRRTRAPRPAASTGSTYPEASAADAAKVPKPTPVPAAADAAITSAMASGMAIEALAEARQRHRRRPGGRRRKRRQSMRLPAMTSGAASGATRNEAVRRR